MTSRERADVLSRVVRAREALFVGDPDLAVALLDDLEADLRREQTPRRFPCSDCPAVFEWGEQLIDHRERMHP